MLWRVQGWEVLWHPTPNPGFAAGYEDNVHKVSSAYNRGTRTWKTRLLQILMSPLTGGKDQRKFLVLHSLSLWVWTSLCRNHTLIINHCIITLRLTQSYTRLLVKRQCKACRVLTVIKPWWMIKTTGTDSGAGVIFIQNVFFKKFWTSVKMSVAQTLKVPDCEREERVLNLFLAPYLYLPCWMSRGRQVSHSQVDLRNLSEEGGITCKRTDFNTW